MSLWLRDLQDILYLEEDVFSTGAFFLQGLLVSSWLRVQLTELVFGQRQTHAALLSAHRAHVHREILLYTDMYQISARKIFRLNIYYKNKFNSWVTATWSLPGSCAGLVTARPVTSECTVYTGCLGSSPAFASLSHTHTEKIFKPKASNSQIKWKKKHL